MCVFPFFVVAKRLMRRVSYKLNQTKGACIYSDLCDDKRLQRKQSCEYDAMINIQLIEIAYYMRHYQLLITILQSRLQSYFLPATISQITSVPFYGTIRTSNSAGCYKTGLAVNNCANMKATMVEIVSREKFVYMIRKTVWRNTRQQRDEEMSNMK